MANKNTLTVQNAYELGAGPFGVTIEAMGPGNGDGGAGNGNGNGQGNGNGSGKPVGKKGDLYGDQYVYLRDLDPTDGFDDPTDGDGDGEVFLDGNGNPVLLGTDGREIHYVQDAEDDWIIPAADVPFTQTVELGRANVARAPEKVMEKSLTAALAKIAGAEDVTHDAAGRIVVDGSAIDSPLENLALYQYLMTAGGESSWPEVIDKWDDEHPELSKVIDLVFATENMVAGTTLDPSWDPSSLLAAAFDKAMPISQDAVLYENTVLGINDPTTFTDNLGNTLYDYFEFNDGAVETYSYDRMDRYSDTTIQWYENIDADPELELVSATVFDAVFGDGTAGSGSDWTDPYANGGFNDFAQAVEDARAVISFVHDTGAVIMA